MPDNNQSIRFDPNKPLAVGGQAVIEGVMMRAPGKDRHGGSPVEWRNRGAKRKPYMSLAERNKLFKLPILRGAAGLGRNDVRRNRDAQFLRRNAMHEPS